MLRFYADTQSERVIPKNENPVSLIANPFIMKTAFVIAATGWVFLMLAQPVNAQQVTMDMLRTRIRQFETCLIDALDGATVKIIMEDVRQNGAVTIVSGSFSKTGSVAARLGSAMGKALADALTGEKTTIYNSDLEDFVQTDQMSMEMGGSVVLGEFNIVYVALATPRHQYDTRRPEYISTRKVAKCL